jgi:hypothetical protein
MTLTLQIAHLVHSLRFAEARQRIPLTFSDIGGVKKA